MAVQQTLHCCLGAPVSHQLLTHAETIGVVVEIEGLNFVKRWMDFVGWIYFEGWIIFCKQLDDEWFQFNTILN